MSSRYASSGRNRAKVRATPSAIAAIEAKDSTKITVRLIQRGSAGHPNPPTNCSRPCTLPPCTGNTARNSSSAASGSGARRKAPDRARPRRNPTPTPRKLASRTKFVKNER